MPYKCAFGHTSYDPLCDACDSETTGDNPYYPEESELRHKAAIKGQTLKEYLAEESADEDKWP